RSRSAGSSHPPIWSVGCSVTCFSIVVSRSELPANFLYPCGERVKERVDLALVNDQRRADGDRLPDRTNQDPIFLHGLGHARLHPPLRRERLLRRLVLDNLDGADQSDAAGFANIRKLGEAVEPF